MELDTAMIASGVAWIDAVGGVESVLTSLAILVGGVWTYFKFFRGRTFRERLEAGVSASRGDTDGVAFLEVVVTVRNVGLSKVPIVQEGSGLRILSSDEWMTHDGTAPEAPTWTWMATESFLEDHKWVEPGETVTDSLVFRLPSTLEGPVRLELHVVSKKHEWVATTVTI